MFALFTDSFINDCLLQPTKHLNQSLLLFADIMDHLLIAAALFSRYCRSEDSDLGY